MVKTSIIILRPMLLANMYHLCNKIIIKQEQLLVQEEAKEVKNIYMVFVCVGARVLCRVFHFSCT